MFLMNAPPVLALQSRWEAFGPPGSFRFPGCFSEAEQGVASRAVRAKVHMLIGSLQGARAAQGTSHERALHGSHRAERGRHARRATSPAPAACGLVAGFDPKGDKDTTGLGPSLLDSDSDDSVDRDIEEAIQEYLKAKSRASQPPAATDGDSRCKPGPPQSSTPTALCPPERAAGSGGVPGGRGGAGKDQGSASPLSVSSEDSFEQSIQAEIEQFLSEKRQHETPEGDVPADEAPDAHGSAAGPASGSGRELITVPRRDLTGACKGFVFRKPPRLAKATAAQPRVLRAQVTTEPADAAQRRGAAKRSTGPGRRARWLRSAAPVREASDSSSDDGIEEAIQLYQLEKRKEAVGDAPGEGQGPHPPPSTSHSAKSALPETHRKMPGKKKPVSVKAVDLGLGGLDPDHPSKPPRETKAPAPPGTAAAKGELGDPASCRADTPTELMCAEAILDISKTILPAPGEGSDRPPSASPPLGPPNVPSRSDGDSSSVDSDDSIEQEIRSFLARKAQSGSLLARAEAGPPSAPSLLPSPGPNGQAGGPKAPVPKTQDLSPSCKRKRRGGGSTVWPPTPRKAREPANEGGALDTDHSPGATQPGQGKASEVPAREGEVRGQLPPCRPAGLGDEDAAPDGRGPGKAAEARSVDEKDSSEDKSSSLDSDEDLDTAIKDLLRSKRKLKRRCRDPRALCKKKVRFLEQPAGAQGDRRDPSPQLHSRLPKARKDGRESPARRPTDAPPALGSGRRASEGRLRAGSPSDDSSCVDSDDSIELEIRRFLAEKAKESVGGPDLPGEGPAGLGPGGGPRPEPPCRKVGAPAPTLPGVCTRSHRARRTPRAGPPAATPRGPLAPPGGASGTASARGPLAGRRGLCPPRAQGPRGAGASGPLPGCAEAGSQAGSPGAALPLTSRSPGADGEGGAQAGLSLPWGDVAPQSRLQSTWALSSDGGDAAWKGGLGAEREKGPEGQAPCATGPAADPKQGLPFAGFSPLLSTQLFHFGKSVPWGGRPAGLFSSPLGLPPQGPAFSAFRDAPAGHGPVFGSSHVLTKKDGAHWPGRKLPAALGFRDRSHSGPEEAVLDLRYRRGVLDGGRDDQEAWDSDASELSDTSVEEGGGGPVPTGSVLQL